jgi:hypothetical protein
VWTNGLEYVDDQGCRCFIDFSTCRANVRNKTKMPEWLWTKHPEYVGFRDIVAEPPHITLATNPPTRFLLPMPGASINDTGQRSSSSALEPLDFYEFERRLYNEAGVRRLDMS